MGKTNKAYIYKKALLNIQNTLVADIQGHKPIKDTVNKIFDMISDALNHKEV